MVASALCFALVGLGVKWLSHVSNFEVNFYRSLVCVICCWLVAYVQNISVWGNQHRLLTMRGVIGAIGAILLFITLQHLPLAIASIIQNTAPIFTAILGIFMLRQPVSLGQWFCFAIAMGGIVLANGFNPNIPLFYVTLGLLSAFFIGMGNNLTGMLKGKESTIVIVFYLSLFTTLGTSNYVFSSFSLLRWEDFTICAVLGILSFLSDLLSSRAFQLSPVALVSGISYVGVPLSLFLGYLIIGETYSVTSLLGIGLVIAGAIGSLFFE